MWTKDLKLCRAISLINPVPKKANEEKLVKKL